MNDGTFQVGEIAVFRNLPFPFEHMNGQDTEILGALAPRYSVDIHGNGMTRTCYVVMVHENAVAAIPEQLKKKPRPPTAKDTEFGKTVEWDDCAWTPNTVEA